jgi:hypothetical protein
MTPLRHCCEKHELEKDKLEYVSWVDKNDIK